MTTAFAILSAYEYLSATFRQILSGAAMQFVILFPTEASLKAVLLRPPMLKKKCFLKGNLKHGAWADSVFIFIFQFDLIDKTNSTVHVRSYSDQTFHLGTRVTDIRVTVPGNFQEFFACAQGGLTGTQYRFLELVDNS